MAGLGIPSDKQALESITGPWCERCWCVEGTHEPDCPSWLAGSRLGRRVALIDEFMLRAGATATPLAMAVAKFQEEG